MKLFLVLISVCFFSCSAILSLTPQTTIYKSSVYHINQDFLGTLIIDLKATRYAQFKYLASGA